jgi:hypothetical protein
MDELDALERLARDDGEVSKLKLPTCPQHAPLGQLSPCLVR